jgi:hypothetical protein
MPTKFENMIMQQYLDRTYGVVDDFTEMGTEMAAGTEPEGATPMTLGEFATSAADVPAGLLKGAVQGTIGLPGDIESIAYGVREIMNKGADESFLTAFVRGIQEGTVLPTTEDVKKWLDENLGTVVPEGASERRIEAAKIPEFVGEIAGAGQTVTTATKAAARGAKRVGKKAAVAAGVAAPAAAETENK